MTNPVTFMFEGVAVDLVALELGLGGRTHNKNNNKAKYNG